MHRQHLYWYTFFFRILFLVSALCIPPDYLIAQDVGKGDNQIKVLFARNFLISREGEDDIQRLSGQVELRQKNIRMYCDSATILRETVVQAFGNVVFWEGDTLKVFCHSLYYDADSSQARLMGDIQLLRKRTRLFTDTLWYDLNKKEATYKNGGIFLSGNTQLSSKLGMLDTKTNLASFKDSVVVIDPDFAVRADTLAFDTDREIMYFLAPTRLRTDSAAIYTERGFYETISGRADFVQGAQYRKRDEVAVADTIRLLEESKTYILIGNAFLRDSLHEAKGKRIIFSEEDDRLDIAGDAHYLDAEKNQDIRADSIRYNKKEGTYTTRGRSFIADVPRFMEADRIDYSELSGYGLASGNIIWRDTAEQITLFSDTLLYQKSREYFKAYNRTGERPLMIIRQEDDSLFLSANTLFSIRPDTTGVDTSRVLVADQQVRVFKSDLQAICDSLAYHAADSLIALFKNPVAWSDTSQFTADSLMLYTGKAGIRSMQLKGNGLIVNELDSIFYNQVQGKTVDTYFEEKNIRRMSAWGNAEVVYYIKDDEGAYVGVDKTTCGFMNVFFGANEVERIVFFLSPKSQVMPMRATDHVKIRLRGFRWRDAEKPLFPLDVLNPSSVKSQQMRPLEVETNIGGEND